MQRKPDVADIEAREHGALHEAVPQAVRRHSALGADNKTALLGSEGPVLGGVPGAVADSCYVQRSDMTHVAHEPRLHFALPLQPPTH